MSNNVLLLNGSYEPLKIIKKERAIKLIYKGVAVIVKYSDERIRSVNHSYNIPCIIKLKRYINIPRIKYSPLKKNIFNRDNHTCQYCGSKRNLTIDHVTPKSKGGKDTWSNLVTACIRCNNKKGDKTLEEAGMILQREPKEFRYINILQKDANPLWQEYLYL